MFNGFADEMIQLNDYYLRNPVTWIVFAVIAVMFVVIMVVCIVSMIRIEARIRRKRREFDGHHRY